MTLSDCIKKHGLSGSPIQGDLAEGNGFVVYPENPFTSDLWRCTDYVVSSTSGGCVWLVKRRGV